MTKIVKAAVSVIALIMVLYHLVFTLLPLQGPIYHVNTHMMFSLLVVFLVASLQKKSNHILFSLYGILFYDKDLMPKIKRCSKPLQGRLF